MVGELVGWGELANPNGTPEDAAICAIEGPLLQAASGKNRFWEHQIRNDSDLRRHVDYIHINPVKHGYVKRAADWRYSSIHRYIQSGDLAEDWTAAPKTDWSVGERGE